MNIYEDYGLPFTQLPNVICDALLQELTGSEFKVMIYLLRKTFGYHKTEDTISEAQFLRGTKNKKEEQVDCGAGITESTLKNCLRNLASKGYVLITRHTNKPATYKIAIDNLQTLAQNSQHHTQVQAVETKTCQQNFSMEDEDDSVQTTITGGTNRVLPDAKKIQKAGKTVNISQDSQGSEMLELSRLKPIKLTARDKTKKYAKGDNIYPSERRKWGQVLSPTKEKTHEKTININHVEKEAVVQLILKELNLSTSEAEAYAELILFTHKRDFEYVDNLIRYLISNPAIKYPTAAFRKLAEKNEVRFPSTSREKPASLHKSISPERLRVLAEKAAGNSGSTRFGGISVEPEVLVTELEDCIEDCVVSLNFRKVLASDSPITKTKITPNISNRVSLTEFLIAEGILSTQGIQERLSFWLDGLLVPFTRLCEFAEAASLSAPGFKSFTFTRQLEVWQTENSISTQIPCHLVAS